MLAPGDRVPDASIWLAPREPGTTMSLAEDAPTLFVFFLFAWAKSQ